MTTTDTRSTKELFRQWRSGDAAAGQVMAQRFADWYYAIAISRLGEAAGREPCDRACARFGEGVVKQTDARQLVKWAHEIIQEEVQAKGSRVRGDDDATAQKTKAALVKARKALPAEVRLVELCYTGGSEAEIGKLAEPLGGMPIGVLKARYRVKQWLRDNAGVKLEVAPDNPVLDRAPLPLYESGRMASATEEANFEQWMLSDLDLCKDIAEFASFAIALRGGLPDDKPEAARPVPADKPAQPPAQRFETSDEAGTSTAGKAAAAGGALLVMGGLGVAGVLVLLVAAYFLLM